MTTSTDARLEPAFALIADPAVSVLSVDVFDTLIWRKVAEPIDAFALVGERLRSEELSAEHVEPAVFTRLRVAAERRARERSAGPEVTLSEIYENVPPWVLGPSATRERLAEVEVEVERDLALPDLDVLALVRAARAAGKRVVAVSDTYLSEAQLRFVLGSTYEGPAEIERIFTSSDHQDGKAGGLFGTVLAELDAEPAQVVHVGDHPESDVKAPRRLGIRAVYFERRPQRLASSLERERRYIATPGRPARGDFGLTAARSKVLHRREAQELAKDVRAFWDYGATSLGPAFTGFAEWVVGRAAARGAERVFCLMREGELLASLIARAAAYTDTPVAAETIWLSRQICSRAAVIDGTPSELAGLLLRRQHPTIAEFCRTLGVDIAAAPSLSERADLRLADERLADEVLRTLAYEPELRTQVMAGADALRTRLVSYVRTKIGEERRILLVDLGWGATIQSLLARAFGAAGVDVETVGLYLMTQPHVTERMLEGFETEGFLGRLGMPPPGMPTAAAHAVLRSPEILEQTAMPDVGPQIDLDSDLEPVLGEPMDAGTVQAEQRHAIQHGIAAFQREWARYRTELPDRVPALASGAEDLLLAALARPLVAPTEAEARMFGQWLHDENFGSTGTESLLEGSEPRVARYADPETLLEIPMNELYWPYGLAAVHDDGLAEAAEAVAMGLLSPQAASSRVETGNVDLLSDHGLGFWEGSRVSIAPRRNRLGLTLVRGRLVGNGIRRVRIDVAKAPTVMRVDWIALRCQVRGRAEPVELRLERPEDLERLTMRRFTEIRPKVFFVGPGSRLTLDVSALTGEPATAVDVQLGYAAMPVAPPHGAERLATARWHARSGLRASKRIVLRLEDRTGLPVGDPLRRAQRRLRGLVG